MTINNMDGSFNTGDDKGLRQRNDLNRIGYLLCVNKLREIL